MKPLRCPICRRPVPLRANLHRPFCSDRCRRQDLANWVMECYRIPVPAGAPDFREKQDDDKAE